MHVIPQSWAHFHILMGLVPSIGLIFAICVHVAAIVANSQAMKRTSLVVYAVMGVLAIPTYFSGTYAMEALSANPRMAADMLSGHYLWGMWALGILILAGAASTYALWRAGSKEPLSMEAVHLVLGLALVTLGLMAVVNELGWQVNHREFRLDAAVQKTPQLWSHAHTIVNHLPTIGLVFSLVYFIAALALDSAAMKKSSLVLFVVSAILVVPTFVTGSASMWALTDPGVPGISKAVINSHRDVAVYTLFAIAATGVAAWIELWRYRQLARFSKTSLNIVLGLGIITLGLMAETGHRGGQINHPEIVAATDILPTDPTLGMSPAIELLINHVIWFVPWQTLHFFGYCLIFGTAFAVSLRVLGFWKSMPYSAVHRLLPLGVFGVVINVFSGALLLQADAFRYLNSITFVPKTIFIAIGAISVLYFSVSDRLWSVQAGQEAPIEAKWVATIVLLSWAVVIAGGRLIPYV